MRTLFAICAVLHVVAAMTCCTTTSAAILAPNTTLLKTKWAISLGSTSSTVLAASHGTVVLNDESSNIFGVDAATGTQLWTLTPPPPQVRAGHNHSLTYELSSLALDANDESHVFALYIPGDGSHYQVRTLDARTGDILCSFQTPFVSMMGQGPTSIVVATMIMDDQPPYQDYGRMKMYNLSSCRTNQERPSGSEVTSPPLVWDVNVTDILEIRSINYGEDVVVLATLGPYGTQAYSLSITTGSLLCTFSIGIAQLEEPMTVANNLAIGGARFSTTSALYDAFSYNNESRCEEVIPDLHLEKNTYTSSGDHFYSLDNADMALRQISTNGTAADWITTVVGSKGNQYTHQLAAFPEAHDPRFFVFIVDGSINVVDKVSGQLVLGTNTTYFPFGPGNSRRQLLFLLSQEGTPNQKFLIPNLQGWTIFEAGSTIEVVEVNQHTPISPPLTYMNTTTHTPYVIFVEFGTGQLRAVELG